MTRALPRLPYDYDGLEPFISTATMKLHHGVHQTPMEPGDLEIARRVAAGDIPAFERLMRRCNRASRQHRSFLMLSTKESHMSSFLAIPDPQAARRLFLARSGFVLSGAAVALLAGRDALAAKSGATRADDVRILNTALGAELEAIAAYQLGAESGLLQKPALGLALQFQGHHKEHADLLAKTVKQLGGKAVPARSKYDFPAHTLKTQADVLRFAAQLEQGAVSAYLGAVPLFGNRDLSKAAASILGDEAMHWAILRNALGEDPVPVAFVA